MAEKLSILVLDDDALIRKTLSDILSWRYDLILTRDYSEFTSALARHEPDIIFLDLNLPDAYGIDICRDIRADRRHDYLFVIIITGSHESTIIENGYAAGADDFIRKPFIAYEIQSKVSIFERVIQSRQMLEAAFSDQLLYNKKLYKLQEGIRTSLKKSSQDSGFNSAELLRDIVDCSYIEMIAVEGFRYKSLFHVRYGDEKNVVPFSKLSRGKSLQDFFVPGGRSLTIKKDDTVLYSIVCPMEQNNRISSLILLESETRFSQDDRKIMRLYIDYMSLINERFNIENILKVKNREYKSEISKIRKIQVSHLPDMSSITGYDIAASYLPAQELSGDFFDGFYIDDNIYQLILCDISGHGMASAYVGTQIRELFRRASEQQRSPAAVARFVSDAMLGDLSDMAYFGTVIICQIHLNEGKIVYLNAGHPSPLFFTRTGEVIKLQQTGPLLGLFEDNEYHEEELYIYERECLFLYTDGIIEASAQTWGDSAAMYGEERLMDNFIKAQKLSSRNLIHSILGTVYEFIDYSDQDDDITVICIRKDSNVGNIIIFD